MAVWNGFKEMLKSKKRAGPLDNYGLNYRKERKTKDKNCGLWCC